MEASLIKITYCQKLSPLSPWACLREAASAKAGERVRVRGKKDFSDGLQNTF
jgi:hypothetical protein